MLNRALILATILCLLPARISADEVKFEINKARLQHTIFGAQRELIARRVKDIRHLYENQHASLREIVTVLGQQDRMESELHAVAQHLKSLRVQSERSGTLRSGFTLVIPGFESVADLSRFSLHPLPFNAAWETLAANQSFRRSPGSFLSSNAWQMQSSRIQEAQLPNQDELIKLAELHERIADASERAREIEFRPIRTSASALCLDLQSLSWSRRQHVANQQKDRAQRVAARLRTPSKSPITTVSYTTDSIPYPGPENNPNSMIEDLDNAVAVARRRIDSGIKNIATRLKQRDLLLKTQTNPATEKVSLLMRKLAEVAMTAANEELEIRRAEHLYLIGRRNDFQSNDADHYDNWPQALCRIFELRSSKTLPQMANIKVCLLYTSPSPRD